MALGASRPVLYSMWACPYAQRAWVALERKGVPYEYKETDLQNKSAEFLAVNPRGLVPALVVDGQSVYESNIVVEYVDEQWPDSGPALYPKSAFQRAIARIWIDHVGKRIVPEVMKTIMSQNVDDQQAAKDRLTKGIVEFCDAMAQYGGDGPFFFGNEFGAVDIALAPFAWRINVALKHYRNYSVPESLTRYHTWWAAVAAQESWQRTLCSEDRLVESLSKYANNTATSQTAKAINAGQPLP